MPEPGIPRLWGEVYAVFCRCFGVDDEGPTIRDGEVVASDGDDSCSVSGPIPSFRCEQLRRKGCNVNRTSFGYEGFPAVGAFRRR
jgi:hypothetical protein